MAAALTRAASIVKGGSETDAATANPYCIPCTDPHKGWRRPIE
jgi:hypothetical protein